MGTLPSGTVTFLFTDIEGSTKLALQYPDSISGLLERHHAILKASIEGHSGYVFHVVGDAFCAAFPTVREALEAAISAQRCLNAEPWGPTPICVRMGIASGRAEVKLSDDRPPDYSGYASLALVQRIMSVAHGGQILLADASAGLVRGELPDAVNLRDMGEHRLKSLLNPERLWQVVAPGLPSEFPPLTSLNSFANNLPPQLTTFIGRENEIQAVRQLLCAHHLVTLTGVGGTGKTRLALQVSADVMDHFEQGVWLVELAAISDPELIPQAIAAALGVREQPGSTFLAALKESLGHQCLLIVLDNCEHMLEGCGRTADILLHAAPKLRILATSREALGIAGEAILPVPSLSLPAGSAGTAGTADAVSSYEAVRLFIDRAAAVLPGFRLTDDNAAAVAQVCARLDGVPLAIELAAARVKGMSVEQIAVRLQDRFRLLTGGSRTALPRQRTLQATIDWSYKLLTEEERSMLRQLSVFSGGWTLEAAESVCSGPHLAADQVLDVQLRLIDKSLVTADTHLREPRYRMLETIRQYAQEKLDDAGEAAEARTRHLGYYINLAERAEPGFLGKESPVWLKRMDQDRENLRAAIDYAVSSGHAEDAVRLFGAAFWLWVWEAPYSEGQRLGEAALASAPATHTETRAKALTGLAFCVHQQSDYLPSLRVWDEALPIWEALQNKWWQALVKSWYGSTLDLTDLKAGIEMQCEAVRLAREANDPWMIAQCLWILGSDKASDEGNLVEARALLEESLGILRALEDPILLPEVVLGLGKIAEAEKDYPRALRLYEESLVNARNFGDVIFEAYFNLHLGRIVQRLGDNERAADLFAESLRRSLQRGMKFSQVRALSSLGVVAHARGDPERAIRLISAGQSLYGGIGGRVAADPCEHPWLQEHLSAARGELGEEQFAALSKEGEAMTVEQAVQHALGSGWAAPRS